MAGALRCRTTRVGTGREGGTASGGGSGDASGGAPGGPLSPPCGGPRAHRLTRAILGVTAAALVSAGTSGAALAAPSPRLADVAYAGSLQLVNEQQVGPAFQTATGDRYQGRGGGSFGLAQNILGGEIRPNVFMSVGAAPIQELEPKFTDWYVQFLASPLVIAYNPHTKYAGELQAIAVGRRPLKDLFQLMAQPGFHLGRTNPNTDPQGQAFVEMVELAQKQLGLPAASVQSVLHGTLSSPTIFAETGLDAQLQSGQLDAASAFLSQAIQLKLPYIALPASLDFGDPALASAYAQASVKLSSGKVVHGVPLVVDATILGQTDYAVASAFLTFLLSPQGLGLYRKAGYAVLKPTLYVQGLPQGVLAEIGRA